jgi:hypothetical protein
LKLCHLHALSPCLDWVIHAMAILRQNSAMDAVSPIATKMSQCRE